MRKSELKEIIRECLLEYSELEMKLAKGKRLMIFISTSRYEWNDIRSDLDDLTKELGRTHDAFCMKFGKRIGHTSRVVVYSFRNPNDTYEVSSNLQKIARNVSPKLGDIIRNSRIEVS
jgi:hypothetical protein